MENTRSEAEQRIMEEKFGIFKGKYLLNFRSTFLKLKESGKCDYFLSAAKVLFNTTSQSTYRRFEEFFSALSKAYWEMRKTIDTEQAKIEYDEMQNVKGAYARGKASPRAA